MRVAVHFPDGSVAAYRLGRIEEGVDPLSGTTTDQSEIVERLASEAREEFPDCDIVIERYRDHGDSTGSWSPVKKARKK